MHGLRCYGNIARTQNVSECFYSLDAWFQANNAAVSELVGLLAPESRREGSIVLSVRSPVRMEKG